MLMSVDLHLAACQSPVLLFLGANIHILYLNRVQCLLRKLICAENITYTPGLLWGGMTAADNTHCEIDSNRKDNWQPMVWPPSCKSYY